MNINDIQRKLSDAGWYVVRQRGTHRMFQHATIPGTLVMPVSKDSLQIGMVRKIEKMSKLKLR